MFHIKDHRCKLCVKGFCICLVILISDASVPVSVCLSLLWTAVKKTKQKKLRRVCSAINCLVPTNSKTAGAVMNTSNVSISRRQTH